MRVATASSGSNGALTSEKMRCRLFSSGGGWTGTSVTGWPASKSKPGGQPERPRTGGDFLVPEEPGFEGAQKLRIPGSGAGNSCRASSSS
ncbi:MAG TPA: hypothetical protein VFV84_12085, partial [Burkholderiales bacterium]|nr:hypothetical protein [Burkholderiales bacterium]